MARNIVDVINQIKPILIAQEIDITKLDEIISSAEYSAPENAHLHWERLRDELMELTHDYFREPNTIIPNWVVRVSNIVTDQKLIGQDVWEKVDKLFVIYRAQNFDLTHLHDIQRFLTYNNVHNEEAVNCKEAITNLATEMLNQEIQHIGQNYIGKARHEMPQWLQEVIAVSTTSTGNS